MAKINPNQMKGAAAKAGVKVPTAATAGVKAPAGMKIKSPDQMKKMAQERAKARAKRLMRILMVAVLVAIVAGVVYFVKYYGRQPKDALENAIEYAYKSNVMKFRHCFTENTIKLVDGGDEVNPEAWEKLMDSITPGSVHPKILDEKIEERNKQMVAQVTMLLDGEKRTVHLRQDGGKWLINLNTPIDPTHVTLPPEIPAEYMKNFKLDQKAYAWWDEEPEGEKKEEGVLSKFKCGGSMKKK